MLLKRCLNSFPSIIRSLKISHVYNFHVSHHVCGVSTSAVTLSGSSHWANIKHTKATIDQKKGLVVTRCINDINMALKLGKSSDPKQNNLLARALSAAKSNQVKQDTVDRALQRFNDKGKNSSSQYIDVKGPEGSFFIIQVYTDKLPPLVNIVRRVIRKAGTFLPVDGGIRAHFNEVGVVLTGNTQADQAEDKPVANLNSLEEAETIAIEVEAEDVERIEGEGGVYYEFTCSPKDLTKVSNELSSRNIGVQSAEIEFRPIFPLSVSADVQKQIQKFYDIMDEVDDVEKIFDNINVSSSA